MSEEEKKVAEAKAQADAEAKAKADEEAEKANQDDSDDAEDNDDSDDEEGSSLKKIDYKAELEKEKKAKEESDERAKKAETALAEKRFKAKHKDDEEEDDGDEDEEKPLTRKEVANLLETNRQKTIKETNSERALDIAKEISDSDEEAEYVAEIYKNRQFPSHLNLREQIEEAHAIANRKKIVSEKSELERALRGKSTVSTDTAGTHRDGQEGSKPKMSTSDESAYKRAGFVYDTKSKLWTKKLPNGKTLVKNSKTKTSYLK